MKWIWTVSTKEYFMYAFNASESSHYYKNLESWILECLPQASKFSLIWILFTHFQDGGKKATYQFFPRNFYKLRTYWQKPSDF